jgi:hypothetical protein
MTVLVAYKGILATDSQITKGNSVSMSMDKVMLLKNITYKIEDKELNVVACAFCGRVDHIQELIIRFNQHIKTNKSIDLLKILNIYSNSLVDRDFGVLFLLQDSSVLTVDLNKYNKANIVHHTKNTVVKCGVGKHAFANVPPSVLETLSATEITWAISKIMYGCGGLIKYTSVKSPSIKIFTPQKHNQENINNFLNTILFKL